MSLLLIDDQGTQWDGASRQLRSAFDSPYSGGEFVEYAILNLGFIAINLYGTSWQIRFRPSIVTGRALAALTSNVTRAKIARVVITHFDSEWSSELIASKENALLRAEELVAAGRRPKQGDFLARPTIANSPTTGRAFAEILQAWPKLAQPNGQHRLIELLKGAFNDRYVVVKQEANLGGLIFQEFGSGLFDKYETWRTCAVGAPVEEQPDRSYGRWIAESYLAALTAGEPQVQDIDAIVRWPHAGRTRLRYRRLLLPLTETDGTRMLLSASLMDNRVDLRVAADG